MQDYRFNDGKISPGGVFIGGRMHKTGAQVDGKHGRWYRLEWHREEGKSRLVQVSAPNQTKMHYTCMLNCDSCALVIDEMSVQQWPQNAVGLGVCPS